MLTKLCGFTDENSVKTAILQKCDFLGFVFCEKSPRFISPKKAASISSAVPSNIFKVAVMVNPEIGLLEKIAEDFSPNFFQFHGDENAFFLGEISKKFPKIKIIKAIPIARKEDLKQAAVFEDLVDLMLLDSKVSEEFGGSGKSFDWDILQNFSCKKNWFLSGGINTSNLDQIFKIKSVKMIDVSSGIEEVRGRKSPQLIAQFMTKIRDLTQQ